MGLAISESFLGPLTPLPLQDKRGETASLHVWSKSVKEAEGKKKNVAPLSSHKGHGGFTHCWDNNVHALSLKAPDTFSLQQTRTGT